MRIHFFIALLLTMAVLGVAYGQQPQGIRTCTTSTSGSISHEQCTFTPLIVQVQAPPVTVQPAPVTVQPAPVVVQPAPAKAEPPKKVRD